MATSKTLTPTNVTISIPEFTDQPDQRVNSNCIDKEADAINALNDNIASLEGQLCIVQNTDVATQNISTGEYVLWKGTMTKATQFIGTGGGLNSTRLPSVTGGGLNDLNSKLTNYLNAVTQNLSYNYPTTEIISGTGTFRNYPTVGYNANFVSITGVVRINSFSRTGSNPGIKITLPVNVKTVYKYDCVMTTAASTEFATIYASGNTVNVSVSESISNYNSANMTIIFMNVVLERS